MTATLFLGVTIANGGCKDTTKPQRVIGVVLDLSDGKLSETATEAVFRDTKTRERSGFLGSILSEWERDQPNEPWMIIPAIASANSYMSSLKPIVLESLSDLSGLDATKLRKTVKQKISEFVSTTERPGTGTQIVRSISAVMKSKPRPTELWIVSDLVEQDKGLSVDFSSILTTPDNYQQKKHSKFVDQLSKAMQQLDTKLNGVEVHILFNPVLPKSYTNTKSRTISQYGMVLTEIWSKTFSSRGASSVTSEPLRG